MDAIRGWDGTTDDDSKDKVVVEADWDVEKRLWTVWSGVGEVGKTREGTFQSGDTELGGECGRGRGLVRGGGGVGGVWVFLLLVVGVGVGVSS